MALSYFDNSKYNRNDKNNNDNEDIARIITDEPTKEDVADFGGYSQKLSKIIVNSNPRFTVGIFGGWGTGKTTLMEMIQKEIENNKDYSDIATTIWFDSWRYERDEYSLMIPLIRSIILKIEETLKNDNENSKKNNALKNVKEGFYKLYKMINSTARNLSIEGRFPIGPVEVGGSLDIGKIIEDYESEGSVVIDGKNISFYKHSSDRLKFELQKVREFKNGERYDFRIVIFIDDLDRCTPERALEILESIKTFFDIEGIIYVIGMDPQTIDPIIKTKYGDKSKIDGMDYLQKIVQLPFQIPIWNSDNLTGMIEPLLKKAGLSDYYGQIQDENNKELIIKATQLNPRDIKRFVNSIVLAKEFYGHKDIDQIIAIQAFYFHGYKWIKFLEQLIPYVQRITFLMHFILLLEIKKDITSLDDLTKIIKDDNYKEKKEEGYLYISLIDYYQKDKLLNDIYSKLIEIDDNDLFTFLKIASVPLLKIDKIENYLRIVDTTGLTIKRKDIKIIDSQKQLELLQKDKVTEFNDYRFSNKNIVIHLPYADLRNRKLAGKVNLTSSLLFKANLSGADLSKADLSSVYLPGKMLRGADLSRWYLAPGVILLEADLSKADLSNADLSQAYLSGANLSKANLSEAKLGWAKLTGANLFGANLSSGDLSQAYLSGANLSGADLSKANLSEANLSYANLTDSIIINNTFSEKTVVLNANFENAIIDNHEFLEHLRTNKCLNIPEKEIKNKQELRLKLESRILKLDQNRIIELLNLTKLPST